jgi:hypothetical protein
MAKTGPSCKPEKGIRFDTEDPKMPEYATDLHQKAANTLRHSFLEFAARDQGKQPESDTDPDPEDCEHFARDILGSTFMLAAHAVTTEAVHNETLNRYHQLDSFWVKGASRITPFKIYSQAPADFPVTTVPLGGAETVTMERFVDLVSTHPEVVFEEFRLRSLGMDAMWSVIRDLNHIANAESSDLQVLSSKIHQFADQVTALKAQAAAHNLPKEVEEAYAEVIAAKDTEIEEMKEDIAHLVKENRKAKQETPLRSTTPPVPPPTGMPFNFQVPAAATPIGRNESSLPARPDSPLPTPTTRSVKAEAPPVFTNDKPTGSSIEVKFKSWFMLLKAKLVKNADHFANDREKIEYIASRLGGSALDAILPWITANFRGQVLLNTTKEVLDHMYEQYHDPNEYETARLKYRDLRMSPSERFATFRIEFTRWASQAGVDKDDMKRDLHEKLPKRLNELLAEKSQDNAITYEQYCKSAMIIDFQQQRNYLTEQAGKERKTTTTATPRKTTTTNTNKERTPSQSTPRPTTTQSHHGIRVRGTARDGNPVYHRPNAEQMKMLLSRGQCFTCHEPGHRAPECQYKGELDGINTARINGIAARLDNQTDELKDGAQEN